MAEIWFQINEDRKTLREVPFGKKPLEWCIENLGLRSDMWLAPFGETPPAITQKNEIRVVFRIKEKDIASISSKEWKIGHYVLDLSLNEIWERL